MSSIGEQMTLVMLERLAKSLDRGDIASAKKTVKALIDSEPTNWDRAEPELIDWDRAAREEELHAARIEGIESAARLVIEAIDKILRAGFLQVWNDVERARCDGTFEGIEYLRGAAERLKKEPQTLKKTPESAKPVKPRGAHGRFVAEAK